MSSRADANFKRLGSFAVKVLKNRGTRLPLPEAPHLLYLVFTEFQGHLIRARLASRFLVHCY